MLTLWAAGSSVAAPLGLVLAGIRPGLLVSAVLTLALVPAAAQALRRRRPRDEPDRSPETSGMEKPRSPSHG